VDEADEGREEENDEAEERFSAVERECVSVLEGSGPNPSFPSITGTVKLAGRDTLSRRVSGCSRFALALDGDSSTLEPAGVSVLAALRLDRNG
jgi:hypothetical protein